MAAQRRSSVLCFQLEGVEGPGAEIGRGSYAVVEEYGFQGLLCVGKSIHKELYDNAPPRERETMLERFEAECEMLSRLRHPHIVQFLGVHFNEGSPLPVLLMERLHSTLAACVDRHGKLPDECCYSVLCDVGVGLRYLHGHIPNPIIHRDLTANNVLLTPDLAAKISDLGVARILNLNPARMTRLTKCPGTPSYMPPEALVERPIYSTKMDIFAYGNLMTHVFSGRWPIPAEIFRANPSNPHDMTPLTEVQRREAYLNDIGDVHPLMGLMRECLSNNPTLRPNIPEALHRVKEAMPQFPPSFENRAEVLQRIQADATRISLNQQVSNLSAQVEQKEDELRTLSNENAILNEGQLQALSAQLEQLQKALNAKDRDISSLRMEVSSKDAALQAKDSIIAASIRSEATRVETLLQRIQTLTDENAALNRRIAGLSIYCVPMKPIPGQISESAPHVQPKLQTQLPPPLPPKSKSTLSESQLLDPQCKPKWRRGADLPVAMSRPHLVKIRNNFYCGGGITDNADTARLVFKYVTTADTWSPLPPCPTRYHGLSELDNALVSVGGVQHNAPLGTPTNSVFKFQDPNWVASLPPMNTARFDLSTLTYNIHLFACGGVTSYTSVKQYTCTTTVEMLNSETGQWSTLAPLPFALRLMSTAISNGRCYLIGGEDQEGMDLRACSASLPLLIESASQPSPSSAVWEVLPNCPLYGSTAAELGGCVLALGGISQDVSSADVYLYSRNSKSWRKTTAVNFPIASYRATSATLAGDSIVVLGGQEKRKSSNNTVFIARLEN